MSHKPILYSRIIRSGEMPKLVHFLIKTRVVRSQTQAMLLLMLAVALFSGLTVYFYLYASGGLAYDTSLPSVVEAYPY
ncbi:MAG: hypothetical protein A2849_03015 [Candidatus Taylorbacteria bacterium RIFCSPHIGHO2_01_FULL_51_15]|uniref:Uncharacterized protein n=1 Tax=Candidatus Taylorbacteria bacterium RIFCSPHIGHO2_01_FULL_51_15 TaxID=1802304 RepID=A0A1G2M8V9_9BACT|nr:MAG: hypothetical protein A2849_03015 [Candidatus Taylorbacteria bacterium RIFCSPHIGHO2_01_FULL_51_15]